MTKHERIAGEIEQMSRQFLEDLRKYDKGLLAAYDEANGFFRITSDTPVDSAIDLIAKRDDAIRRWKEENQRPTRVSAIAAKLETEYGPVEEAAIERPKVICLCGSSRFIDIMAILAWEFEKLGAITLSLHLLPMNYAQCEDHLAEKQGVAEQMDELHLRKIDISDEVFIVNKDGYIGDSTKREIRYANEHSKPIKWLEPEHAEENLIDALGKPFALVFNGQNIVSAFGVVAYGDVVNRYFAGRAVPEGIVLTVTYSNGPASNPSGSLTRGQQVKVCDGMIFNAAITG